MAYSKDGVYHSLPAAADYSSNQFHAMTLNSSGQCELATTQGERCIGILQDDPAAAGRAGSVQYLGVGKAELGGTVSIDDQLITNATGELIATTADTDFIIGRALEAGVDGDVIAVALVASEQAAPAEGQDGKPAVKVARATYDFSVDGGAISTIDLGVNLPDNAVVTRAFYYVETTLTSATDAATIALGYPTDDAAGLLAAVAISAATDWDAGWHECIQDGTAANFSEITTAARALSATIAVEAVTAGKFILFAEYVVVD